MRRDRTPITKADVSRSFIYQNDRARALIANAAESTARARYNDRAEQAAEVEQAWKDRAARRGARPGGRREHLAEAEVPPAHIREPNSERPPSGGPLQCQIR